MIKELIEADCIKIGNFKLKNGEVSKYYYDMKNLILVSISYISNSTFFNLS